MAGFKVVGTPRPKGSLICRGPRYCPKCKTTPIVHPVTEDDTPGKDGAKWRTQLQKAGDALRVRNGFTYEGPVTVDATFVMDRPAAAAKRRWPHVRPDLDKLCRMLLDALTSSHVIHDDSLVVELVARKCYPCHLCGATQAGVIVHIGLMQDPDNPTLIGD